MTPRASIFLTLVLILAAPAAAQNFVVHCGDPALAAEVLRLAEHYRRQLSLDWFGDEMPRWSSPCPIVVQAGAGAGVTSFVFENGEVSGWRMTISGPRQRLLYDVLPHEVMHTVLASHFRAALPRGFDEGTCGTVESETYQDESRQRLLGQLQQRRLVFIGRLFHAAHYPADVMPLYDQGRAVCEFLVHLGGKRKFVAFLSAGMRGERWTEAVASHYGYVSLVALQEAWLSWVRAGFPAPRHTVSYAPGCYQWDATIGRFVPCDRSPAAQSSVPAAQATVPTRPQPKDGNADGEWRPTLRDPPTPRVPEVDCQERINQAIAALEGRLRARLEAAPPVHAETSPSLTAAVWTGASGWLDTLGPATIAALTAAGVSPPVAMLAWWLARRGGRRVVRQIVRDPRIMTRHVREPAPPEALAIDEVHHNHVREVPDNTKDEAWAKAVGLYTEYYPGSKTTLRAVEKLRDQILRGEPAHPGIV